LRSLELTNSTGGVVARYEDTQNIDEPLAMLRGGATNYFHADGLGDVTSLWRWRIGQEFRPQTVIAWRSGA